MNTGRPEPGEQPAGEPGTLGRAAACVALLVLGVCALVYSMSILNWVRSESHGSGGGLGRLVVLLYGGIGLFVEATFLAVSAFLWVVSHGDRWLERAFAAVTVVWVVAVVVDLVALCYAS